jgi:WD40 repeat protein
MKALYRGDRFFSMSVVFAAIVIGGWPMGADAGDSPTAEKVEAPPRTSEWDAVLTAAFSPDGKLLAAGSCDGPTIIWDVDSGRRLQTLVGHYNAVYSLAFSPDGKWLVTGSADGMGAAIRWDVRTGKPLCRIEGHPGEIHSVAIGPNAKVIATGTDFGRILISDAETGRTRKTLVHGDKEEGSWPGYVTALAFNPDGKLLASGSEDKTVILWDVESGNQVCALNALQGAVTFVAFSPDGRRLATATGRDGIVLWDIATGKKLQSLGASDERCHGILSSDWKTAVIATSKRQTILNVETGHTIRRVEHVEVEGEAFWAPTAFSPDGKLVVAATNRGAELRDVRTGTKKSVLSCRTRSP